ncbi:NAD(P)/FAD-dependent oxidoreductase [Roseivirga sp. BDSF3-8]|uniref:NAD(P)/FAD-dependent oxidoreductase n=1 Tax=Roseivirga sp. BDSF3-8 TaxID=3241598 RepID=UPI003531EAA9
MIDFLIVGQGIAGTILSYILTDRGYRVMVIDKQTPHSSSRVAAGIYNPVTGRVMKKTWLADTLFHRLVPFYRKMEADLKVDFLNELPIYRPFISMEEQNDWVGKSAEGDFDSYVEKVAVEAMFPDDLNDHYGGLLLKNSGYLDIPLMLDAWRQKLTAAGSYRNEAFTEESMELTDEGISYKDIKAKKVIFCQGNGAVDSRYFGWLPFRPVKGEVLTVSAPSDAEVIYNRGVFMLPKGGGTFRVGATYNWRILDTEPTDEAREELLDRLKQLYSHPVTVENHIAGIRPATKDRKPFAGVHPEYKAVAVFNGLGTKGVSLAPHFGEQMADFLCSGTELSPEVNITRFYSLYFH